MHRLAMSRRSTPEALAVLLTAVAIMLLPTMLLFAADHPEHEGKTTKILLIGHQPDHPPGTHLYLPECELLARCLRKSPGVEAVVSDGWPQDPKMLDQLAAIVLYSSPGADLLFGQEHAEEVQTLLDGGVGLVALHWATGAHGHEETEIGRRYLEHLGGLFSFAYSGLDISPSRVEQLDASHPVCRGWSDFDLMDEFYLDLKFLPEALPVLKVAVKGKDQTVAWVYERPGTSGGRSYGNTLGHFDTLFQRPGFRKMLLNGILWTAHCEIPSDGAPCEP
jgi:type 1 glutamine amidotransferase